MAIMALKCPSCGANIDFDNSRDFGFCCYCGTKIIIEKKIIEHRGSVGLDHSGEVNNLLLRGKEMLSLGRNADAEVYFNRVLDFDATNYEARNALHQINSVIEEDNVFIERLPVTFYYKSMIMKLLLNGQNVGILHERGKISLRLPVGTHFIEPYFQGRKHNNPVKIVIADRHTKVSIAFAAKAGGAVDVIIK